MEISNSKNYLNSLTALPKEIVLKYDILIKEYLELFEKNVKFTNNTYSNNIFLRGLSTINNVFNLLLLYTKNLELSFMYSQKSIFYYIEFIDQISEDANSFLQLNSQDAVLFVYKKTIYEINNDYRKELILTCEKEKKIFYMIKQITSLYENIIIFYLNNNIQIKEIESNIKKIFKKMRPLKINKEYLTNFNELINNLAMKNISVNEFNHIAIALLKSQKIDIKNILLLIETSLFIENKRKLSPIKFSHWLIGK